MAHHAGQGGTHLVAELDHLGAVCLTALHLLLAPVHRGFQVLLLAGLGYALWDRFRAWRRTRLSLGPLACRRAEPGDPFWEAAVAGGLDPSRLRVVEGLPVPAFTAGLLRPQVYIGRDLAEELTGSELAAVLAHEGAHVARRDPLRLSGLRLLACTLFWIPALRRLADDVADEIEIAADDRAAPGRPLALATAILTLSRRRSPPPMPSASPGFHHRNLLERRIRRLVGDDAAVESHVTRRSLAGTAAAVSLAWVSAFVVVHPLPADGTPGHRPHCDHPARSPLAHLFCLPGEHRSPHCPHESGPLAVVYRLT
ncbi:MAG: M56 family metallopeptidase [Gemmatimonadales bacterium]|nr:M56 family metallopeptidase [Gemmatimonadales bacterium]